VTTTLIRNNQMMINYRLIVLVVNKLAINTVKIKSNHTLHLHMILVKTWTIRYLQTR